MMRRTDRTHRALVRCITLQTLLYTEMVSAAAIVHGDSDSLLRFDSCERPLVLQIGGGDPEECARAVERAEPYGYNEYNLNVGCPSKRVQGRFGACLMAEPERVAAIVTAMCNNTTRPVTVKHRLGIDNYESHRHLQKFVACTAAAGAARHIVHARLAILEGLSPRANRSIPPIRYDTVYRLKKEFPTLTFEVNGHVKTLAEAENHLRFSDGVMIGRQAYANPWILAQADSTIFNTTPPSATRRSALTKFAHYIAQREHNGDPPRAHTLLAHLAGFFHGCHGSRAWRRTLNSGVHRQQSLAELILSALEHQERAKQPRTPAARLP